MRWIFTKAALPITSLTSQRCLVSTTCIYVYSTDYNHNSYYLDAVESRDRTSLYVLPDDTPQTKHSRVAWMMRYDELSDGFGQPSCVPPQGRYIQIQHLNERRSLYALSSLAIYL